MISHHKLSPSWSFCHNQFSSLHVAVLNREDDYSLINVTRLSLCPTGDNVILQSPVFSLFVGESVTLRCKHRAPRKPGKVTFFNNGSAIKMDLNHRSARISDTIEEMTIYQVTISDGGSYKCQFDNEESKETVLKVEGTFSWCDDMFIFYYLKFLLRNTKILVELMCSLLVPLLVSWILYDVMMSCCPIGCFSPINLQ